MFARMRSIRLAVFALIVTGGLAVASCGGGSVSTTPVPAAVPVTTTQSIPTAGGTLSLPAAPNGQVATLAIATGAPAGVALTATSSNTAPAAAPAPSALKRKAQSITGAVPFLYVTFSVSAALSAQYLAVNTVSLLPTDPTVASYYAEFDDITATPGTKLGSAGPATLSASLATFAAFSGGGGTGTSDVPTLVAGHTYLIQFYYVPGLATSSPTPSATATATASATANPTPTPTPTAGATASPLPQFSFTDTTDGDNTGSDSNCTSTMCAIPLSVPGPTSGGTIVTFGTNNLAGGAELFLSTATGADPATQITPANSFPYYTGTGTVAEYLQLSSDKAVSFAQTPTIQVGGVTGAGCTFYGYTQSNSNAYAWTAIAPATGAATVSSGNVTINPVTLSSGTVNLSTTPFYGAIVCQ